MRDVAIVTLGRGGRASAARDALRQRASGCQAADHRRTLQRAGRRGADSDRGTGKGPRGACRSAGAAAPARHTESQGVPRQNTGNPKVLTNPEVPAAPAGYGSPADAPDLRASRQLASGSQSCVRIHVAHFCTQSHPARRRRRSSCSSTPIVALIGGGLSAVLGAFALGAEGPRLSERRWTRAGTTSDLKPDEPVARVLSVSRVDGWYRARARETVFLVWDGDRTSSRDVGDLHSPRLPGPMDRQGEEVQVPLPRRRLRALTAAVLAGPPPRPLARVDARIDPADSSVLVRL